MVKVVAAPRLSATIKTWVRIWLYWVTWTCGLYCESFSLNFTLYPLMPPLSLMDLKKTSTPRARGLPMGSATGPEYGERIPSVMVFALRSTPVPALIELELPLLLAQPDRTMKVLVRMRTQVRNDFLSVIACSS